MPCECTTRSSDVGGSFLNHRRSSDSIWIHPLMHLLNQLTFYPAFTDYTVLVSDKLWPPHKEVIVFCVWISFKCQQQAATACCGESLLLWHKQTHKQSFWAISPLRFLQCSINQFLWRRSDVKVYSRLLTLTNIWSPGECYMVISPEVDGCLPFVWQWP